MRRATRTEYDEQKSLMQWCGIMSTRHPELALIFAIPNGGGFSGGFKSNLGRVQRMKSVGLRSGIPDLFLPVGRRRLYGLFIEMKAENGSPTKEQTAWHVALRAQGYAVQICWGMDEAVQVITDYLEIRA